jgi:hypothetical protein
MLIGKYLATLGISFFISGNASYPRCKSKPGLDQSVDSVKLGSLASAIPGVLELLDIPYTGADILGLSLDTNKFLVKKLLQQNGVPVPNYQLFNAPDDYLDPAIRFPLISKLNAIHGSVEITRDAVSENEKQLRKRLRYLMRTYKQPVLVEEFTSAAGNSQRLCSRKRRRRFIWQKRFSPIRRANTCSLLLMTSGFPEQMWCSTTLNMMIHF